MTTKGYSCHHICHKISLFFYSWVAYMYVVLSCAEIHWHFPNMDSKNAETIMHSFFCYSTFTCNVSVSSAFWISSVATVPTQQMVQKSLWIMKILNNTHHSCTHKSQGNWVNQELWKFLNFLPSKFDGTCTESALAVKLFKVIYVSIWQFFFSRLSFKTADPNNMTKLSVSRCGPLAPVDWHWQVDTVVAGADWDLLFMKCYSVFVRM